MRRRPLVLSALSAAAPAGAQPAAAAPIPFHTAGPGSAFLPYGEALARFLATRGVAVEVRRSAGSLENLARVEDDPAAIGTAFLGSAADALQGTPAAGGRRHRAVRALFPMYETAFMVAAPRARGIARFADLEGKRVGCGPARGPAETFFRAAAEVAGFSAEVASGDSAALVEAVLRGEIDALWQGAIVPIPALAAVADRRTRPCSGRARRCRAAWCRACPTSRRTRFRPGPTAGRTRPSRPSQPGTSWWATPRCRRPRRTR
jgi:TRAP transporter TAXI family solute receptor